MESLFQPLIQKWPNQVSLVSWNKPLLVLSKHKLNENQIELLKNDYLTASSSNLLSVVISLKMLHIYFRLRNYTYDYRPHRGIFSNVEKLEYRVGNSERVETLLKFEDSEIQKFLEYVKNIQDSPMKVLGKNWMKIYNEPDFSVYSHLTEGNLKNNQLLNKNEKHNCLTWFTTAPIGPNNETMLSMIGMTGSDIKKEAHSYIVELFKFFVESKNSDRIPGFVLWTNDPLEVVLNKINTNSQFLMDHNTKRVTT